MVNDIKNSLVQIKIMKYVTYLKEKKQYDFDKSLKFVIKNQA